jgi:hypothetical protein
MSSGDVDAPPAADAGTLTREEEATARGALRYVGIAVLAILLLAGVGFAIAIQVGHLPDINWHLEPGWLVLSAVAFAGLQLFHASLWRLILVELHGHVPASRSLAIWSVSALGKYVPTTLLLFVTRISMAEKAGVARRVSAASMAYELPITVSAALAVGAYGVVQLPDLEGHAARWLVIAAPVVALAALHPRVFRHVGDALLRRIGREPLPQTLSMPRVLGVWALYCVSFLVAGVGTYAFCRALHPVATGDVPLVFASFAIALALSYFGFLLPAGIGAREAGFTAALALALPMAAALAVAVGIRLLQIALEVLFALVTPLIARRRA